MTHFSIVRPLGAALFALMLACPVAGAAAGGIRDHAAFFSEQAKAEAARGISEISRRFKKDLVVETFTQLPDDLRQGLNLQDKASINRVFDQWALRQARELKVNGVYVLLAKEPAHLQVVVGTQTQAQAFTLRDRDTLVSIMLGKLRQKQNDEALLEAVNFVSGAMAGRVVAAARPAPTKPSTHETEASSPWGWVIAAGLGFLAAWVVVGLIRALFRGGAAAGTAPGGGGSFLSSLLGGMLGAAAGMWLYDQFTNHNTSGDSGFDDDRRRNDGGSSGSDSDYSSSGGDYGDSGGGDSGGGDF